MCKGINDIQFDKYMKKITAKYKIQWGHKEGLVKAAQLWVFSVSILYDSALGTYLLHK